MLNEIERADMAAADMDGYRAGRRFHEAESRYDNEQALLTAKPGDGVTLCGYSDRHAYTIISRKGNRMVIQKDKAVLLNGFDSGEPDALEFYRGGFCGHVEGTQRYRYEQDTTGSTITLSLRTVRGRSVWARVGQSAKNSDRVVPGRSEHYDYNF